jgi:hypothetical protein
LRAAHFPEQLVNELLSAYCDTKHNFLLSGLRLSAVEGGRFCEAALRLLEHATTGSFTDLKRPLDSDGVIKALANLPHGKFPTAIRLHIPRPSGSFMTFGIIAMLPTLLMVSIPIFRTRLWSCLRSTGYWRNSFDLITE